MVFASFSRERETPILKINPTGLHMTSMSANKKNHEIEALRAIAVFLPVLGHMGNLLYWNPTIGQITLGLWAGVDIFFCISGYVIANAFYKTFYSTARREDKTRFVKEVVSFYIRRAYRILPSAWLWIAVVCVCSVFFNQSGIFGALKANLFDALSIVLSLSNFHFASCYVHTLGDKLCGNNSIYWSVSLEEQFYFLFPFLFFLRIRWISILTGVILLATAIMYYMITPMTYVLFSRVDGILLGVGLAIFQNTKTYHLIQPTFLKNGIMKYVAAPFLVLCILMIPAYGGVVPFVFTLVSIMCVILVWVGSYNAGYLFPSGTYRKVLAYIGTRSFAIYLIHNPVFWATREIWFRIEGPEAQFNGSDTVRFLATAIVLIVVLCEANYRLIENPLRKRGIAKANKYLNSENAPVQTRSVKPELVS
ncbi:acyltransferase family protein [Pseudomonas sp. S2_F03]